MKQAKLTSFIGIYNSLITFSWNCCSYYNIFIFFIISAIFILGTIYTTCAIIIIEIITPLFITAFIVLLDVDNLNFTQFLL